MIPVAIAFWILYAPAGYFVGVSFARMISANDEKSQTMWGLISAIIPMMSAILCAVIALQKYTQEEKEKNRQKMN